MTKYKIGDEVRFVWLPLTGYTSEGVITDIKRGFFLGTQYRIEFTESLGMVVRWFRASRIIRKLN